MKSFSPEKNVINKKEMMEENEIIKEVVGELQKFQLAVSAPVLSLEELQKIISDIINRLIINDFSRLISVLYRLDISEKKLKELLKNSIDTSAGDLIAGMIIERQSEKIKTRKLFSGKNDFSDEEKW